MPTPDPDPYRTLGVAPSATDEQLRAAYRRLAQRHHPDHNNGSPESARRFSAVQEAYARVRVLRAQHLQAQAAADGGPTDDRFDARLAEMERELQLARTRREQAMRDAQRAAQQAASRPGATPGQARPSDEELGYVCTDDSFSKILDDFADEVSARLSEAADAPRSEPRGSRGSRGPRLVADWIDELGARLTGEPNDRRQEK